jgi:amino acid adenylation domain-containing protein
MSERTDRLAGLSLQERAQLFEKLREHKKSAPEAASPKVPPLCARDRAADPPPLSFAQQRLWFLDRLMPGNAVYNIATPLSIDGPLDVGRLGRALAAVVARHESLRTTFRLAGTEPVQVIAPADPAARLLPVVDLTGLKLEAEVPRLRDEEASRAFDLAAGPLLRAALLRLAPDRHVLLLTLHHIVSDGWSNGVLTRDLTDLYAGRGLPELPIQYADFAVWQWSWLAGEVLAGEIAVWKRRLAGMPPTLDLPADRPRPALRSSRGALLDLRLGPASTARLKELARGQKTTLFTVLLATFQALLHRLTGQEDLCVGTPVANRSRTEVEGLIGFFVNTLVLRGDLSGDPGLAELIRCLREVALEAFEHQHLPFEKLVEELRPPRDPSRTPLVQVLLTLQNTPLGPLAAGGLRLEPAPLLAADYRTAKLDVSLTIGEEDGGLGGSLTYGTDLFDAVTMQRFAAHFVSLTEAACAEPQRRLSELPFLAAAETAQLLREWNDTGPGPDRGEDRLPLHLRFAAQAVRTPEAVAVETAERSWIYRELALRAGRLARRLRALGVGPEVVVGVQADRSPELALAALAVWTAGGAYLPLDPSHPRERRAWTLADAGAALLLDAGPDEDAAGGPPLFAGPVIRLGEEAPEDAPEDFPAENLTENRAEAAGPPVWESRLDSLAYVLYTSGSSGRPKGVMVSHRSLANLAAATARFAAGPGSRVLLFASPAFDASLLDLALALGSGAALCLVPGRELLGLGRLLSERAITHLHLPPSALAALAAEEAAEPPAHLACVILGGEPCPEPLAARWGNGRRLFNDYGPTEATVFASVDERRDGRLSTGRPIAGVEIHLLDRRLQPVPIGVPGEVCLAGAGLARGYLGRPDLTAERFVPHPFAAPAGLGGARLYRTGDLARRWPDGRLDYLGRIDRQVKIRGVRTEPGEVEAALIRHPGVREAVVMARTTSGGEAGLAAWVVPEGAAAPAPAALRAFLRDTLPAPMVPGALYVIDRLPLTANGKVDRSALARYEPAPGTPEPAGAPPVGALEGTVAEVWCEALGVERVARDASFFDLGGHSLLVTRVQARLAERLGREVPLLKLFEHTTVEALAAWLNGEGSLENAPPPEAASQERAARQRQGFELQRRRLADRGAPR